MPVTKASCLSLTHARTGLPSEAAMALARSSSAVISPLVLDYSGAANHTRPALSSRTTYKTSWPFSG